MRKITTQLHNHPYFYSPWDGKRTRNFDERAYVLFRKAPSLLTIIEDAFEKSIGICALSSCHTPTSGMDHRFELYIKQLSFLRNDFLIEKHEKEGWFYISRKKIKEGQLPYLVFLHTQEVRTDYRRKPADINIIGSGELIMHSQDIDETSKRVCGEGKISLVCHPASQVCSAGYEKANEMVENRNATAIEKFSANQPSIENELLKQKIKRKGPAVADSHHYSASNAAYCLFGEDLWKNFSIEKLRKALEIGEYDIQEGYIRGISSFIDHKLPILLSSPGIILTNPKEFVRTWKGLIKQKLFGK